MKGRDQFTVSEAKRIRELLGEVRRAEPGSAQKVLRDQLRAIGFYISDWAGGSAGFTASEFDDLVEQRQVTIEGSGEATDARIQSGAGRDHNSGGRAGTDAKPEAPLPSDSRLVEQACEALREASPISQALAGGVPDAPGLYAMHANSSTWQALGLAVPPDRRPLYVGKAEDSLVARDLSTHFATGTTGRSSPRRSFAALLADDLGLVPMPRCPARPEPRKWTHYALEEPGDVRLTGWMRENLKLAVWASPPGVELAKVEGAVMRAWLPPLNLTGVKTPWTTEIRRARAVLADRAKDWGRERPLSMY
jgi:hypothetical protein